MPLISFGNFTSFEVLNFLILGPVPVLCILVYRPPKYNGFITELSELLSKYDRVLILGDLTFMFVVLHPPYLVSGEFLDTVKLKGHVKGATNTEGHLISSTWYFHLVAASQVLELAIGQRQYCYTNDTLLYVPLQTNNPSSLDNLFAFLSDVKCLPACFIVCLIP